MRTRATCKTSATSSVLSLGKARKLGWPAGSGTYAPSTAMACRCGLSFMSELARWMTVTTPPRASGTPGASLRRYQPMTESAKMRATAPIRSRW